MLTHKLTSCYITQTHGWKKIKQSKTQDPLN